MKNIFEQNSIATNTNETTFNINDYIDSDNDGIPDEWELNGYTVENNKIVRWNEAKHSKLGLTKYVSDPFNVCSSGGPFNDSDKVLGKIDGLKEAKHPLVASYPRINVEMERIILSKNATVTQEEGQTTNQGQTNTVGFATSNSQTASSTVGASISTEFHASLLDIGGSVSANFSKESSNTVTAEKNTSTASSQSLATNIMNGLSLNQSEVAFLNGNIRYTNIGTMPIYNLKPTLNFVLGVRPDTNTIATIAAKDNTLAKAGFSKWKISWSKSKCCCLKYTWWF